MQYVLLSVCLERPSLWAIPEIHTYPTTAKASHSPLTEVLIPSSDSVFEGLDYGLNHRSDDDLEKFELFVGGGENFGRAEETKCQHNFKKPIVIIPKG